MADAALEKHGLKKQRRTQGAAAAAAGANLRHLDHLNDKRMDPSTLEASIKRRREKEERLASVMSGREGRQFGSRTTGGLTNKQKQKSKAVPLAVHRAKLKARTGSKKRGKARSKQFQGKKAWKV
eukprot:jgi/Mesen1/593/ME001074S10758